MSVFQKFVFTPAGHEDVSLAIAASRAGGVGILNADYRTDAAYLLASLERISAKVRERYGLKIGIPLTADLGAQLAAYVHRGLSWLILDAEALAHCEETVSALRRSGIRVLAEIRTSGWSGRDLDGSVDGLLLKGNESGGLVGEDSSFILLQKWLKRTTLPLYVRGGLTPQVAAACSALGVAGGVLDAQVLLLQESGLPPALAALIENLAGSETVAVGDGERGEYFRLLVRPGLSAARTFAAEAEGCGFDALAPLVRGRVGWSGSPDAILPVGQDVCFAAAWRSRYGQMADVFAAIDRAVDTSLRSAVAARPVAENAPLAESLGVRYPLVQGPMTRVSDSTGFARAVAEGGALPMLAFALLKGPALEKLLTETTRALGDRAWGIGLLGFAPQALLDEQLTIASRFAPDYAIIAGGRPDQAVRLEAAGIRTYLHVPSANLLPMFLQEGARRFIFEGRECGGHIGPLSSFVLWSSMVDRLVSELDAGHAQGDDVHLLFAGGIHDAASSAMVQVLVAPLVERGVRIGILMGSAYLFTREIVASGAIVAQFQREVIGCERTVNLESGPGHASRCAYTPFAQEFFRRRAQMRQDNLPADEARTVLDDLILGRLRIASKGRARTGADAALQDFDEDYQRREGMYMLGQVATLRAEITDIAELHRQVTEEAAALLAERLEARISPEPAATQPADIAIVGIASVLPKAAGSQEYWENILDKIDAITEIPSHRWDWRLYFDADRSAKDKVYSKWGGFLDDMAFDPTRYGMPPKSIASVDPMQLMALEVAQRTLADAGYDRRHFDRERASIIVGASGGAGDVGTQYGLRAELPRFMGALPGDVADRLPEWTEDSFAGILINVIAGRIANRLNFGGVNFTTDAACASSLAAIYQGVSELTAGRSDFVIAGGVDTVQGPFGYLCFSKTQALSPRGRCSTFDAAGDGIVISEGIAMVAMKRLADAERDGDRIYAVIKGVGGSSDGNAKGMTAPLPAGQLRAMRRAYRQAGFGPQTVALFEAHGTGTVAGDSAELESTTTLIKEAGGKPKQAVIGSVKTMIGHTKATAGIAGLIKATLALHHRVLPPHHGVTQPNAILRAADNPLYLTGEALPWLATAGLPRRAAVSAFGFGGTNFHVVMEEYTGEYRDWLRPAAARRWPAELLVWSGADRVALIGRLNAAQELLDAHADIELRDLGASLAKAWQPGAESLAVVAGNTGDLAAKLAAALAWLRGGSDRLPSGIHHGTGAGPDGKLAVLFPGQGSQYPDMLRELAVHFPEVAGSLSEADALLMDDFGARPDGGHDRLSAYIYPRGCYGDDDRNAAKRALTATDIAQPALGAVEAGLLRLLRALGVKPDMLAGHSYGEFVALHAGGAFDFATLVRLSAGRGRCIVDAARQSGAELGTMAAVPAARKDVETAIAGIDDVIVANHNAPLQSIISGSGAGVDAAMARLADAGIEATRIPVAAAFHSSFVRPARDALAALIDAADWHACRVPVYSNTTAAPHAGDVRETQRRMAEHLTSPVEFVAEVEAMHAAGARVFLEVGPKSVLTRLTAKILEGRPHRAIAIDDGNGIPGLLNALAQLLCAGVRIDIGRLFAGRDCLAGDPARPESLRRRNEIPRHAWMLNGSGARRASEPVRQVGVSIEQTQPRSAAAPAPVTPTGTPHAAQPAAPPLSTPTTPQPVRRKERHMAERRPMPVAGGSAVMAEYFDTMRQFLETQERVMAMFMNEPGTVRAGLRVPRQPSALTYAGTADIEPVKADASAWTAQPVEVEMPKPAASAPIRVPAAAVAAAPAAPQVTAGAVAPKKVNGTAKPEKPASAGAIDRPAMTEILFAVVEDKTGYPRDMVGLDQNLEADLGIDSIKRIEVVGAMLQKLPETYKSALGDARSRLNTQTTLNGMLDLLSELKVEGAETVPFEDAGVGATAGVASHLPRYTIQAAEEPLDETAQRRLTSGHFLIARDTLGVADIVARTLTDRGCTVAAIDRDTLADEAALGRWIAEHSDAGRDIAGIVHLAAIGAGWRARDASLDDWRRELQLHEKSLFMLVRDCSGRLADAAHVIAASGLGGRFCRSGAAGAGLSLQGGAPGMLKSLFEERPQLRVKAVDTDITQSPAQIAAAILAEMELVGGRHEVGYPHGVRTVFHTVPDPLAASGAQAADLDGLVVLATGGARGVTAEVLRDLAVPGNTLLLTGRHTLAETESGTTCALTTADALRQHFIAEARSGAVRMTPADIQRRVQAVLAAREMRANIADYRSRGAAVEYHAVDVTDEAAMRALFDVIQQRHGRVDGVVHGAGVIEDKLLADKQSDSWSRVVETKVLGLLLLQRHLNLDTLKFLTVFSSVAGRYGNSGQSDYATANELMNRLCCQLRAAACGRLAIKSLCWGPWGATRFGAGMVTPETERKFAEKGVLLVTAETGRALFMDELRHGDAHVEVICGEGPWERREAANGEIARAEPPATTSAGPMLGAARVTTREKGDQIVSVRLDAGHAYLQQHLIDGVPILPAAAALEIMAEAAAALWQGWKVVEARDCQLLKGVELDDDGRDLKVVINPPPYGSSEGFDVSASLVSEDDGQRPLVHYRVTLRLEQQFPAGHELLPRLHAERKLTVAKAYADWLFHGPCFQVIDRIEGLSTAGVRAQIRRSCPSEWLSAAAPGSGDWLFDPAVVDAAAQMAILWDRSFCDATALPTRFGRVVRYRERLPEIMTMEFECIATEDPSSVRANVHYTDSDGRVVLSIEDMQCVSSAALNRLGGTARATSAMTV
jgi:acyl transferase domain-containing protein/NAD(P)H-dependent flavin oxidoreductase YrpB (nitropropane dioxygenase family)